MTGSNIIDLRDRLERQIAFTGELAFLACPICQDKHFTLAPVVGVTGSASRQTYIAALMCVSMACKGNTILDVTGGVVSPDVRILEDDGA